MTDLSPAANSLHQMTMITAWILEDTTSMSFMVDLRPVFERLGNTLRGYDWLVTNLEMINLMPAFPQNEIVDGLKLQRITGDTLSRVVMASRIQWVWAVFLGFRNGHLPENLSDESYPFADGNSNLWLHEPRMQHRESAIEMVCWDSGTFLFYTRDAALGRSFKEAFPEAEDLAEYCRLNYPSHGTSFD